MTNYRIAKLFILAAGILAAPALSLAGHEMTDPKESKEVKAVVEKAKESCITGDIGITVVSQYISRGVIFENQGGIVQPYADLYFKLYESDGLFSKITLNLGIWNSFHERKTDAGLVGGTPGQSSTRSWYEFDFTAGISFGLGKYITITPSYYTFLSPNDGFSTFEGLNTKVAFDDSTLLGKFALHPYVQVLFELENKAGTGDDEGIYYEVGIAPSVPLGPVTATFPISAGFGSDHFYGSLADDGVSINDEAFGYVTGGVALSYALPFIKECYGTWTVTAGYNYYYLGEGTSDFNTAPRGGAVRDFKNSEHIFSGGLVVAF